MKKISMKKYSNVKYFFVLVKKYLKKKIERGMMNKKKF